MKTRLGLVSNSSSASFIITWRALDLEEDKPVQDIVHDVFGWNDGIIKKVSEQTIRLKSGAFRSTFGTSMYNDISDFGPEAAYLMTSLYLSNNFEIVDARIEDDGM
jgi:hypothetical protein